MTTKGLTDVEIIGMLKTYVKKSLIGQGAIQGQDGFSPTVVVKTNTDSEYVLTITDKNGSYDTPNLKEINIDLLADAFDATRSYVWGDVVAYQGDLYKFNRNHSGNWNSTHADKKTVVQLIGLATNTYNVIDYGLDRTGNQDCTAKLQAMVDSVPSGSVIYFPQGIYEVTDTITINKNIYFKGESEAVKPTAYQTVLGSTRPESAIRFRPESANRTLFVLQKKSVGGKNNIGFFDGLSFYAMKTENKGTQSETNSPIHVHGNNKSVPFDGQLPYHVWTSTNLIEGINGLELSGANNDIGLTHVADCTFVGFSGFAVKVGQHRYIENCTFLSNETCIEESGTDAIVNNCWFSQCGTAIKITHEYFEGYSNVKVNNCWCDQMEKHFIHAPNIGSTDVSVCLLIDDAWVDMIDNAAIYVEGTLHHSIITGRFSRCGMVYAGLELAQRQALITTRGARKAFMQQADVIVAQKFNDNYINISVNKRRIGSKPNNTPSEQSNNSEGYCPSKVIGVFGAGNDSTTSWGNSVEWYKNNVVVVPDEFKTQKTIDGVKTSIPDYIFDNDNWFVAKNSTYFNNNKTIMRQLKNNFDSVLSVMVMPTASEYFADMTVQYLGETTDSYTHGLFYDCKEVLPSTDPKTYAWVLTSADASAECEKIWKAQNVLGAKNLLKFPYAHIGKTVSGVTFDVGNDGSITVNGTPTDYASFDLENKSGKLKLAAGDYIFSCSGVFTSNNQYCGVWYKADDATAGVVLGTCNVTRQSVPITITEEMANNVVNGSGFFLVRLVIESGAVDNVVYRPMLRLASDPDDTWTPYAPSNKDLYDMVRALQSGTTATTNRGGDENSDS